MAADTTIKRTEQLILEAEFADEDTRTITQDNPKETITRADLEAVQTAAAGVLIGDKAGADFRRLKSAFKRNTTRTEMEFS